MSLLEWVEEPPAPEMGARSGRSASRRYDSVAEQLEAKPGCWAIVDRVELKSAANSWCLAMEARGIEAKRRRGDDGVIVIYARCPL